MAVPCRYIVAVFKTFTNAVITMFSATCSSIRDLYIILNNGYNAMMSGMSNTVYISSTYIDVYFDRSFLV